MSSAGQLFLSLTRDAAWLRDYLQISAGKPVALFITDNTTSMLSVRDSRKALTVRLHNMFLDAGDEVIEEIAKFIRNRKGETPLFRKFLKQNSHRIRKSPTRSDTARTEGKWHDLQEILHSLNSEYFGGQISCRITWGAKSPRRAARRRTLGSYSGHGNIIRINPILDRRGVPRYFMEFIVYHEMLHAYLGTTEKNGRRIVHSKEFKDRERLFRDYEAAVAWEKGIDRTSQKG